MTKYRTQDPKIGDIITNIHTGNKYMIKPKYKGRDVFCAESLDPAFEDRYIRPDYIKANFKINRKIVLFQSFNYV